MERDPRAALETTRVGAYFSLKSVAILLAVAGLVTMGFSGLSIHASRSDVLTEVVALGPEGRTPALHLRPGPSQGAEGQAENQTEPAPLRGTVIVVHGFAASKEFMREMDYTLARGGYEVYGVDLPGHGRSGLRLEWTGLALSAWLRDLVSKLETSGGVHGGRLYLVGHSLGTQVVTQAAMDNPALELGGVVALSPVYSDITVTRPPNYLALTGQGELPGVKETALAALVNGTGLENPELEKVYGDFSDGTARAGAEIKGASHITVANKPGAITATLQWLDRASGTARAELPRVEHLAAERNVGLIGAILLWAGLFYLGAGYAGLLGFAPRKPDAQAVVEEARVAAGQPAEPPPLRPGMPERELTQGEREANEKATLLYTGTRLFPILFALSALIATLVAGFFGTLTFVGQAVTDYLSTYLLVLSPVLFALMLASGRFLKTGPLLPAGIRREPVSSVVLGVVLFALAFALIGWYATYSFTNGLPGPDRIGHIALLALLFAPFAVVDELMRASVHDRAGYTWGLFVTFIGKLVLAVTWYGALFLPHRPQALLVVLGLLTGALIMIDVLCSIIYNEHGSWVASAVFKALTLAWLGGTFFPLLAG